MQLLTKLAAPLLLLTCAIAQPTLTLAPAFSDHMVLQRAEKLTIWGTAKAGADVSVAFGSSRHTTKAASDGSFAVTLPKQEASASGRELEVRATAGIDTATVTLRDVVVGDVWLCTGQSNMRWPIVRCAEKFDLLPNAANDNLRMIDFQGRLDPTARRYDRAFLEQLTADNYYTTTGWQRASSTSAKTFSAIAFVFGQRLARRTGVPIGLIHNAVGGAPMAAFMATDQANRTKAATNALTRWREGTSYPAWCRTRIRQNLAAWHEKPTKEQPHHPFEPSFLFDAGIAPLKQMPIKGVIWYQGESDATDIPGDRPRDAALNRDLFQALILGFRQNWGRPQMPFYFVQLPGLDRDWAMFRDVQTRVADEDPWTDMVVTLDVGHPTDVHPRRKEPVGERLANLALANSYGQDVVKSGPRFRQLTVDGPRATVQLWHNGGLRTLDNKPVRGFMIAGSDRLFVPAIAAIVDEAIVLTSPDIKHPVAVRYAFERDPDVNLVNHALLPAAPFRTDSWDNATMSADSSTSQSGSFEGAAPGPLVDAKLKEGTWRAKKGHAELTRQFARTGKQCLHLHGGEDRSATIRLAKPGARRMSFWAERWTSRGPFSFRVEARVHNRWEEVFNGDKTVRVGARFLSHVTVDLPAKVTALRFSSTSPAKSGVLLDDLAFSDAKPMQVVGSFHRSWLAPALRGKTSPITRVAIETTGHSKPQRVTGCKVTFSDDTVLGGIARVHVLGQSKPPARTMLFEGEFELKSGLNDIAIAVDLNSKAKLSGRIGASITEITLSSGQKLQPIGHGTPQRIGVALRTADQDDCHTYRIPGLATTNKGTLIAVYDNRYRGGGDLPGDIDVGMSRSTDGGVTWQPMRVIMDMGDDPKWRYDGIGDPEVLVDKISGRIFVAATWSHGNRSWNGSGPGMKPAETGQFMLVHSDDDGRTWSKPRNITAQIKDPKWRFVLQGPGRGITMQDGTLVLAAQYRSAPDGPHKGKPFSTLMTSKDRGETWQIGTGVKVDTTESQVVELADGTLMINCRDNRRGSRSIYTTRDLGKTWQIHPTSRSALIEPTCMASLLRFDHERRGPLLVFSNPNTRSGRYDMTLKVSTDMGKTWPARWHTRYDQRPGAGYSCLTRVDAEHIGVVYEGRRELYYLRFAIRELLGEAR